MYNIELFQWVDSANVSGWHEVTDVVDALEMPCCTSVGYVVAESDEFVYLSTTVVDSGCMSPIAIPQSAIRYRELLEAGTEETE